MSELKKVGLDGFNTIFAWSKSNADGTLCFGDVDEDNVKNAISLTNNYDPRHYIKLGSTGARKGRTTCEAPRGMHLKLGQDLERESGSFTIQVENGNLELDIQNGDLNVKAKNITFNATGNNNEDGNFVVKANQKVQIDASIINAFGTQKVEISSNNLLRLMGDSQVDFISGICNMISYSSRKGKKGINQTNAAGAEV